VHDDRLAAAAEQAEQLVDQTPMRRRARYHRIEDVRIADLLDAADGLFGFEPIHHRLHRGIGRPVALGEGFLNFADR
jgi:hypothetical protein